jgi:rhodanese-related sulfurtransferase
MSAWRSRPVSPDQLVGLMAGTAPHAVLDVRERGAYERGHIFRTTSLPRRLLDFHLPQLITARATTIVLCDEDGHLSELAQTTLSDMGYEDVRVLTGGLAGWRTAKQPLVQGINVPSKVFGERVLHEQMTPEISVADLKAGIDRGDDMVIVDVRTPEEYERGCIPGAFSVPGGELLVRIADLLPRPDTTIVVHCGGRTRSYIGAESLRRLGLPNPIVALTNGTMGWQLAGLDLERGAARWAPSPSDQAWARARSAAARIAAEDGVAFLSAEELDALWDRRHRQNVSILDVRASDEYAAGHIPGAVWAPGGQAVQATDEYVAVHDADVICVCDGGGRSILTASWLRRMGLPNVRVLTGGVAAWGEAGGTLEPGQPHLIPAGYEAARASMTAVSPAMLDTELRGPTPPAVLNVDPSDLYARSHVPGAIWLCRSRLELLLAEALPDPTRSVVVTCNDGLASTLAAATIARLQRGAVCVLDGGTRAWEAASLPVERGATRLADDPDDVLRKPYEKGREAMEAYLRWEIDLDADGQSSHALLPEPDKAPLRVAAPPGSAGDLSKADRDE